MQVIPITPIERLIGKVNGEAGYYIRLSTSGKLYSARCPDRTNHTKTPREAANQKRMAAISAAINRRMHDPVQHAADLAAFNAQRTQPNAKTTLRSFLWALEAPNYPL
ncbi:MAG: hypothetical protein IJS82_01080 [Paludibacteraceae bacterium]|nr:hypothetical protein [Paludibacteraceae bacterium]